MALSMAIMSSSASTGGIVSCANRAFSASSTMTWVMGDVDICVWYGVGSERPMVPNLFFYFYIPVNDMPSVRKKSRTKARKPSVRDRVMAALERKAAERGLMPIGVYEDGRTWKHGAPARRKGKSPKRTRRKPSIKDRIMGFLEEKAAERGLRPIGVYEDGRTWKHGTATR